MRLLVLDVCFPLPVHEVFAHALLLLKITCILAGLKNVGAGRVYFYAYSSLGTQIRGRAQEQVVRCASSAERSDLV